MCLLACATALRFSLPNTFDLHEPTYIPPELPAVAWADRNLSSAGTAVDFDFFLLAQFNPPAYVPVAAQSRAKHAITRHEAFPGFWTHGLWPVR
jgi:ribonuclease I